MLVNVSQLNQAQLALAIQQYGSGAAFSGNFVSYVEGSGYLGPLAVVTTGNQIITGSKRFLDPVLVNYSGGSGAAPSALWVSDQIASSIGTPVNALSGYVQAASGALSYVRVTGSSTIQAANFTGLGGTLVIYSGNQIFISGAAAGGGGGGATFFVGLDEVVGTTLLAGAGSVSVTYDSFLGIISISGDSAGGGSPNAVTTTGNEVIGGFKQFTGSPFVPAPTQPSGAANLSWVSGVSGDLYAQMTGISGVLASQGGGTTNNYYITGTGVVSALSTGNVTNTFNITSGNAVVNNSGTVNNTYNGTVNNGITVYQPTGNYINMSFYFDEFSLATGLNQVEAFIGRSFVFTGYALGAINTGTQGFFTGSFYQRTAINTKTNFVDFSLNSGLFFVANGGYNQEVSGMNRVGLDIYRIGTGITGLSVGLFGVGY